MSAYTGARVRAIPNRTDHRFVSFSKARTECEMGETKFENREVKNGAFVPRLVA